MVSWLTNLFRPEETRDWPDVRPAPLTLDLSRQSLNNVRLGDPADRLKLIGRPKFGKTGDVRYYDYPTLGMQACASPGGIVSFGVAIGDVEPSIPPAQSLTLMYRGRSITIKRATRLSEVATALGVTPKEDRGEDDDEIMASFPAGDAECSIECAADGKVLWVELTKD